MSTPAKLKPVSPEISIEGRHTAEQLIAYDKIERPFLPKNFLARNTINILAGESDAGKSTMVDYWCGKDKHTYVAEINYKVVGTFIIKDNFPGLGSHVANASYMTMPGEFGKGIGRTMAEYSLAEAKHLGYEAMQFNIVVKSNERAIRLWKKLGFEIKGEIPDAFNHLENGYTDVYIMWRKL